MDVNGKREQASLIRDCAGNVNTSAKGLKQYYSDAIAIMDDSLKMQAKSVRTYASVVIYEDKELVSVWIGNLLKFCSDSVAQQQQRWGDLESANFEIDEVKTRRNAILNHLKNQDKKIEKAVEGHTKVAQKYDKQSIEFRKSYNEFQNAQKTGYNVSLSSKQESKLRSQIKDVETTEESLIKQIKELNQTSRHFTSTLKQNFQLLAALYQRNSNTFATILKSFIEIFHRSTESLSASLETIYLPVLIDATSINMTSSLTKIHARFAQNNTQQSDESIKFNYIPQVREVLDRLRKNVEDRSKNARILVSFLTEINESLEIFSKSMFKLMANRQRITIPTNETFEDFINVFQSVLEGFVEVNKLRQADMNTRIANVNLILSEYNRIDRSFQNIIARITRQASNNGENGILIMGEFGSALESTVETAATLDIANSKGMYSQLQGLFQSGNKFAQSTVLFLRQADENLSKIIARIAAGKGFFAAEQSKIEIQDQLEEKGKETIEFKKTFIVPEEFSKDYILEQKQKKIEELSSISKPLQDTAKHEDSMKLSASLAKKFNAPPNDFLVDTYTCSYSSKISLAGKLYIFNTMIAFHSKFNSRTLLGDTVLVIPFSDVTSIEKKSEDHIFDNAIEVLTKKGKMVFQAFMNRDRCFRLIRQQTEQFSSLKTAQLSQVSPAPKKRRSSENSDSYEESSEGSSNEGSDVELEGDNEGGEGNNDQNEEGEGNETGNNPDGGAGGEINADLSLLGSSSSSKSGVTVMSEEMKSKLNERKKRIYAENPKNYLQQFPSSEVSSVVIENTSVTEVFREIFGDSMYKETANTFQYYFQMNTIQDTDISISKWEPTPPDVFESLDGIGSSNFEQLLTYADFSIKKSQFTHPVKAAVGPKSCQVNSEDKVYWLSTDEILIEREFKVSKVPMSDCFVQHNFYHLTQSGEGQNTSVTLKFGFFINFIKSSFFKSMILKSSTTENRETWNNQYKPLILARIKEVQSAAANKPKSNGGTGNNSNGNKITSKKSKSSGQQVLVRDGSNPSTSISKSSKSKKKEKPDESLEKIIELNKKSIDYIASIAAETLLIQNSVEKLKESQENLSNVQKMFFYLLIAFTAITFINLFK